MAASTAARLLTQMETRERLGKLAKYEHLTLVRDEWDLVKDLLKTKVTRKETP